MGKKGALIGALIGFAVGGPVGAFFGAVTGFIPEEGSEEKSKSSTSHRSSFHTERSLSETWSHLEWKQSSFELSSILNKPSQEPTTTRLQLLESRIDGLQQLLDTKTKREPAIDSSLLLPHSIHSLGLEASKPLVDPSFFDSKKPYLYTSPTYLQSSEGFNLSRDARGNLYDAYGNLHKINPMTGQPQKVQYY